MITAETIAKAMPEDEWTRADRPTRIGIHNAVQGWSTSGYWAARFVGYPEGHAGTWTSPKFTEMFPAFVRAWEDQVDARVPVTEAEAERIQAIPGIPDEGVSKCNKCDGTGEHECSCGDLHECSCIDGEIIEKPGRPRDPGQSTWRTADGREIIIADDYADLLRGYHVVLFTGEDGNEHKPLLGLDDDGKVMVAVMPLHSRSKRTVA